MTQRVLQEFLPGKLDLDLIIGGGFNLWKAVRIAKDLNSESIPATLNLNDVPILPGSSAECFAEHFNDKIKTNVNQWKLDPEVYNGKCKLIVDNRNFMSKLDVKVCMSLLNSAKKLYLC